jgi:uncharacterized protein YeaO (DUF488 family)
MVRTKSIYSPKEESDGVRILVPRYHPRGIKKTHYDLWDKRLAPSKELLTDWKQGKLSEKAYTERIIAEMKKEESQQALKSIAEVSKSETITLLCIEKEDGSFCHRHILKRLISEI